MKRILILLPFLFVYYSPTVFNVPLCGETTKKDVVSIVFCGDVIGHLPILYAAYSKTDKTYDFHTCFDSVQQYIHTADIAVANLETTLAGAPYSGYPQFSSPDALLDALQYAGFNVILTANNHVLDRKKKGLVRTIQQIDDRNLKRAGSYTDSLDRAVNYPLMIEKEGVRIAILTCTYGTNGIAVQRPNIVNRIDTSEIKKDIEKAYAQKADLVVMAVHWGDEYVLKSNKKQRRLAQFFVDNGVHLIIGNHPHVVQEADVLYNKDSLAVPVFYSVGNFLSNQRWTDSNGGILVKADIYISSKQLLRAEFLPVYVHKGYLHEKYHYHLIPTNDYLHRPHSYALTQKDSAALMLFDTNTRERLQNFSSFR